MKLYTFKTDKCTLTNFGICEVTTGEPRFNNDGQPKEITLAILNRMLGRTVKEKVTISTLKRLTNEKKLFEFGCQRMGMYKGIVFIKYYYRCISYGNYFIITPKVTDNRIKESAGYLTKETRELLKNTWLGRRIKKLGL